MYPLLSKINSSVFHCIPIVTCPHFLASSTFGFFQSTSKHFPSLKKEKKILFTLSLTLQICSLFCFIKQNMKALSVLTFPTSYFPFSFSPFQLSFCPAVHWKCPHQVVKNLHIVTSTGLFSSCTLLAAFHKVDPHFLLHKLSSLGFHNTMFSQFPLPD